MDFREVKEFLRDSIGFIVTIVIVFLIIIYVATIQQVVGPSMSPTLNNGDVLILNKIVYKVSDINRYDIVVLSSKESKYLVKRIIGLPGDTVAYKNNQLHINGKIYEETFLDEGVVTPDFSLSSLGYETIPEDMFFVVGDNRGNSEDSRDPKIGLINREDIQGKSNLRIWTIGEMGIVR